MLGSATYTVYRTAAMSNVAGVATPGVETSFTARLSVQPFTPSDTQQLPEGLRTECVCKAYSQVELRTVEMPTALADEVMYGGFRWKVRGFNQYDAGVGQNLHHWKYWLHRVGGDER